ncbi:hypothetical protein WDZ92_44630, partial [Nostoc sp. NIES-2111]
MLERRYYIGVDLGQRQDYSTVAVLEDRLVAKGGRNAVTFAPVTERRCALLHLERLAFGTSFGEGGDHLYLSLLYHLPPHRPGMVCYV